MVHGAAPLERLPHRGRVRLRVCLGPSRYVFAVNTRQHLLDDTRSQTRSGGRELIIEPIGSSRPPTRGPHTRWEYGAHDGQYEGI